MLVIGLVGASAGMYARYYIGSRVTFIKKRTQIGSITVNAAWVENGWGQQELKYLVILPRGERFVSGEVTDWATTVSRPEQVQNAGVDLEQERLYFEGKLVPYSDDGRMWIYRTTTQTLEEVEPGVRQKLTTAEFDNLERSPLWRQVSLVADAESQAWAALVRDMRPEDW